jgi:hypothetical protein
MQTIRYSSGIWNIETKVQEVGEKNRLAIISAMAKSGEGTVESKHTVVFEHIPGVDEVDEAKAHSLRVLMNTH